MSEFPDTLAMSVDDLAAACGLSRTRVYYAVQRGELPARRLGKRMVILHGDACAWLESLPFVTDCQ